MKRKFGYDYSVLPIENHPKQPLWRRPRFIRLFISILVTIILVFWVVKLAKSQHNTTQHKTAGHHHTVKPIDCPYVETSQLNTTWPRFDIFLPVAPLDETVDEFERLFLPSYTLFWPLRQSQTNLLLVGDFEAQNSQQITRIYQAAIDKLNLKNCSSNTMLKIGFNSIPPGHVLWGTSGHNRQQWLMFWADNFTSVFSDYVGFVDSDTVFVTRVTKPDLFDDSGRPRVRALYGKPHLEWWSWVPPSSFAAIGQKEPFNCMTYFPVVLKIDHLPLIREHIRRNMKAATFDEAFAKISSFSAYSQFNIMCSYLWYYQRESYAWELAERNVSWQGPVPAEMFINPLEAGATKQQLTAGLSPHLTIHWSYENFKHEPGAYTEVLRTGLCYSLVGNHPQRPSYCRSLIGPSRLAKINPFEWRFESFIKTPQNASIALEAHRARLRRNDELETDWDPALLELYAKQQDRSEDLSSFNSWKSIF